MEAELPSPFSGFPVRAVVHVLGGGTEFQDEDFDIREASVAVSGGEVFYAGLAGVGDLDFPIVLVHSSPEGIH